MCDVREYVTEETDEAHEMKWKRRRADTLREQKSVRWSKKIENTEQKTIKVQKSFRSNERHVTQVIMKDEMEWNQERERNRSVEQ